MSLRWRVAVALGMTVAATVAVISAATYLTTGRELRADTDRTLAARAHEVVEALNRRGEGPRSRPSRGEPPGGGQGFERPDAVVQLLDPQGNVVLSGSVVELPADDIDVAVATGARGSTYHDISYENTAYRVLTAPLPWGGAVQVARDLSSTTTVLDGLRNRLLLIGMTGTAAAAAIGYLLARRAVRPVEQLTFAAEHVAATHDLTAPLDVRGHTEDEVGRLAAAFNEMLRALGESREQQQRLVQDASHELRTPLTSLRTNIEVLRLGDRLAPEDRERLLNDVVLELEELTDLVNELVLLAHAVVPDDEPPLELSLDQLVASVCERQRRRTGREIRLETEACTVVGRSASLERAVTNLISNADKFSPAGEPIEVSVREGHVLVRDHGAGIDEADRPHVFKRFYRAASARNAPGSGLGLAIVEQIVAAHGGRTVIDAAPDGGAIVGFTLPTV